MSTRRKSSLTRPLLSLAVSSVALTTACGNPGSTIGVAAEITHAKKVYATTARVTAPAPVSAPEISPLLLENGQPACGNTGSKAPKPPGCS